ncbi:hypothetical protein L6164_000016 [Bauhinia variegata]|uniref:Uncharacterized protein n=1 Tax=Bauhinia variegata TaxID=167791 RepID=A0ACB9Q4Q5_BAUVA|nr:hypothetical protein L6164_000016 [Bauhinia variegata]
MEASVSRSNSSNGMSSSSSFRLRSPSLNSLRLRRIFDLFDKNGDEMITVNEISQALNRLGLDADFKELEDMIRSYIKPDNSGLMFEDFVALHQSLGDTFFGFGDEASAEGSNLEDDDARRRALELAEEQEESDLSEAFKVFDEDGDGYISANELQVVLDKLGFAEGMEIDRVQKMILSVDRNNDGRVDFFEFKDMMRNVIVPTSS